MFNAGTLLAQECLLCADISEHDILCHACIGELPRLPQQRCPRCALPTPNSEVCGRCLANPPHYDSTQSAFAYDFPLDKLVQSFKYGHQLALAGFLGKQLAALAEGIDADLIIPLPLHPKRLQERGFNQALELARPVSRARNLPIDTASCKRVRHTPAQAELPWRERVKNIRGAFHCTTDLSGKRLLLIDDVMTTGASIDECARTLKLHGAASVSVLVVARALPK
jgi:ComF family protein